MSGDAPSFQGVGPVLRQVFRFAMRPSPPAGQLPWGTALLTTLCVVLTLDVAIAIGLVLSLWGAEGLGYEPPPLREPALPEFTLWLMAIGFLPLIEEIAFRGWLSGRKAALVLAAIGLACISAGAVVEQVAPRAAGKASLCAVAVFVIASFYWMAAQRKPQEMLPWFRRHYATVVWLSSLAFGAIHLTNYEGVPRLIDVFLILPQTVGGILLAYTRTRLGLRAAILHHALFNALAFGLKPFL